MKPKIKRNKEIKIRLTEEEHQALLERMTGGELATWMRSVCLDEKPNKQRNYKVADPVLLVSLARIGGNLNQISHNINRFSFRSDQFQCLAELSAIQNHLKKIVENYDR